MMNIHSFQTGLGQVGAALSREYIESVKRGDVRAEIALRTEKHDDDFS